MPLRDAGLQVLTGFCLWSLLLCSGVRAEPDPRITTTPSAAYEPPEPPNSGPDDTAADTSDTGPRTTADLLTFIRALEAPRGYNEYERRIRIAPPQPLTHMTVGDVLDWQVRLRRSGAVSTAAGGYQIIYPTLTHLVTTYGISRSAKFDAPLQDRLARLLIAECGEEGSPDNHPHYGNCLAGIWAALPLTHGAGTGRSAYHGVAGNKALTTPETVLALLAGKSVAIPKRGPRPPIDPDRALARIGRSLNTQALAFGANTVTVDIDDINTALRKARRAGTLTPSVRSWKQDPYAQN
ncbi:hypothetical protein [Ruegeria sp.]|uniref:hypothetical protein n=1 Tax=Ruegeria sp. TaxID=1879320 RepID=UPI003B000A16